MRIDRCIRLFLIVCLATCSLGSIRADEPQSTHGAKAPNTSHLSIISKANQNLQSAIHLAGSPAKALLADVDRQDFELQVELRATANTQAGVIFRVSDATARLDGHNGYYIGIHTGQNRFIWGATDGKWREIAVRSAPAPANQWFKLRVIAQGNQIQAWINEVPITEAGFPIFDGVDDRFQRGGIGLRVLGGKADFRKLRIRDVTPKTSDNTYTNPVLPGCADPCVLLHQGTYYAYCTHTVDHPDMKRGIRFYKSTNLADWEDLGFAITREASWGESRFWAPDIVEKDGEFYLYYAADTRICVAKASHPEGPFTQIGEQPMEPDTIRIDAHVFQDDDGKFYFYYVHFNHGNEIWGGELNDDMVSIKQETLKLMIAPDQAWERHQAAIAEGPELLKHKGVYYLTYSGSHFENPNYAVGYATSRSPLGPWKKYEHNPIMRSTAYAHGTAHHCITESPDGSEKWIVYHRHSSLSQTEPRRLSIDRIRFVPMSNGPDILSVWGPTSSPQRLPAGTTSR